MRAEDLDHLASSGCSVCRDIARRELELVVSTSGRAFRGANLSSDTYELVKSIAEWVKQNAEHESIFLTPDPAWECNVHALLDHISEVTGISKERIGEWVNV